MRRYLLVALLPAGLAAIAAATVISARRAPVTPAPSAGDPPADPAAVSPAGTADQGEGNGSPPSGAADAEPAGAHRDWVPGLIGLGAISGAGGVVAYGVMALLGPPVVNHGLAIDEPIFRWTDSHQVDWWAAIMSRLNKVGNVWTTWGAVGTAAVCLGVSWRRQRWLPPAALGAAIVVDHYTTHALHRKFNRLGPPPNPLGTYPSGGMDRVVLFYGLIAHMLWREFSGSPRGKACAIGAVGALSFNQAYCREYLSQHWFIDIICGLLYGVVLLVPIMAAVQWVAGPASVEAQRPGTALAPAPA